MREKENQREAKNGSIGGTAPAAAARRQRHKVTVSVRRRRKHPGNTDVEHTVLKEREGEKMNNRETPVLYD